MGRRDTKHFPAATKQICYDVANHVIATGPPSLWIGRAHDPKSKEHRTGLALDIIVSRRVGLMPTAREKAAGNLLVAWLVKHARQLDIRHIIWDAEIWKTRYADQGWRPLPGPRSGISDWHRDHAHVFFQTANGRVPSDPITSTTTLTNPIPEEDDMPSIDDLLRAPVGGSGLTVATALEAAAYKPSATQIADEILGRWLGTSGPTVAVALQSGAANVNALRVEITALTKALHTAQTGGVDIDQVRAMVREAVGDALQAGGESLR
ncbi:hypothetical protein EII34_15130 [Arachnia propionica]|uniref:ARB-07466-like C-terminal domain-containing protein n=1 Tax=Arachnia propionica TaxID=1750 RepID=A0A3P1T332_9ACTN|nr:hypothetical protein [Arachnia propionica]RRD03236.1 hypothetical protein EII34_15130 [Arachnia propionica]